MKQKYTAQRMFAHEDLPLFSQKEEGMNVTKVYCNDLQVGDRIVVFDTVTAVVTAILVGPYVHGIFEGVTYPCRLTGPEQLWFDVVVEEATA
jgi:hypothetical protein